MSFHFHQSQVIGILGFTLRRPNVYTPTNRPSWKGQLLMVQSVSIEACTAPGEWKKELGNSKKCRHVSTQSQPSPTKQQWLSRFGAQFYRCRISQSLSKLDEDPSIMGWLTIYSKGKTWKIVQVRVKTSGTFFGMVATPLLSFSKAFQVFLTHTQLMADLSGELLVELSWSKTTVCRRADLQRWIFCCKSQRFWSILVNALQKRSRL